MLALAEAKDVLLSYQLVGPNILRWAELKKKYPLTHFSSLVDNVKSIQELGTFARNQESTFSIYIDLDLGMGRTGIHADGINPLISAIKKQPYLHLEGLHGYDGHIHNADLRIRQLESEACYALARQALSSMQRQFPQSLQLVLGGSPSFSFYAQKENVICSPGTFIFWDWGTGNA